MEAFYWSLKSLWMFMKKLYINLFSSDVATRLSPACCERMVEVNAVGVIYTLISSCNRSQPHMEIIKLAVSILLNLAKVPTSLHCLFHMYIVTVCVTWMCEILHGCLFFSMTRPYPMCLLRDRSTSYWTWCRYTGRRESSSTEHVH